MLDVAFLRETTKFVSVGLSKKAPRDPLPPNAPWHAILDYYEVSPRPRTSSKMNNSKHHLATCYPLNFQSSSKLKMHVQDAALAGRAFLKKKEKKMHVQDEHERLAFGRSATARRTTSASMAGCSALLEFSVIQHYRRSAALREAACSGHHKQL